VVTASIIFQGMVFVWSERAFGWSSESCSRGATRSTTPTFIASPGLAMQVGALADEVTFGSGCVKTIGGSETSIETPKQFAADFRNSLR
jgi:hypothetical protein